MPYLNAQNLCCAISGNHEQNCLFPYRTHDRSAGKKKKELTVVAVEYVPANQWLIGGFSLSPQGLATFYLDIKVTEGTNTKNQKASYIQKVFAAFEWFWVASIRRAISSSMRFEQIPGVMKAQPRSSVTSTARFFRRVRGKLDSAEYLTSYLPMRADAFSCTCANSPGDTLPLRLALRIAQSRLLI